MRPRDDQLDVLHRVEEALCRGVDSVLIVAPTGWGKTLVLCLVLELLARRSGRTDFRILGVAHRDRLLLQWMDALHRVAPALLPQVTLLNTASPRMPQAHALAIDEGHHTAAHTYHKLREFTAPQQVVAVTATPNRHDRLGLRFGSVIHAPPAHELIAAGVLADYDHFALDTEPNPQELVKAVAAEPKRWGQTLLFLPTIRAVEEAVVFLRRVGIAATAALGDRSREAATAAFAAGHIQVLVSCHALTEGIDVPSVQTVVLRDALPGPVQQAVGRALRRQGNKVAQVVQFATAPVPFITLVRPHQRWVGSAAAGWRALPSEPIWPALVQAHRATRSAHTITPETADEAVSITPISEEETP